MTDRTVTINIADTETVMRLDQLLQKANEHMAGLQDIRDAVQRQSTVEAGLAQVLQDIRRQMEELKQHVNDPQQMQQEIDAIVQDIDSNTRVISEAVKANTAAAQEPSGGETSGAGSGGASDPNTGAAGTGEGTGEQPA